MSLSLRRIFLDDLGYKFLSLLLAFAVYNHVQSQEERVEVLVCPVSVQGLGPEFTVRGEIPVSLRARVRARGFELLRLRGEPPEVIIRVHPTRPGRLDYTITAEDVVLPPGLDATVESLLDRVTVQLQIESAS